MQENNISAFDNYDDSAKEIKIWNTHKLQSKVVSKHFQQSSRQKHERYSERIETCALRLAFDVDVDADKFKLKFVSSWFCRVPFCPICQWRKSMLWKAKFYQALPTIMENYPKARWIFLTLTVKNCFVSELKETIAAMNYAFNKLTKSSQFKLVLGYIKTIEITRNETDNTAHPHFHVLLMVKPSYFKGTGYVTQSEWTETWQRCLKIDYTPIVDVRIVKNKGKKVVDNAHFHEILDAATETLKYAVKPADMIANKEWFLEMADQTFKMRFISTGGVLKDIFKDCEQDIGDENDETQNIAFQWKREKNKYKSVD